MWNVIGLSNKSRVLSKLPIIAGFATLLFLNIEIFAAGTSSQPSCSPKTADRCGNYHDATSCAKHYEAVSGNKCGMPCEWTPMGGDYYECFTSVEDLCSISKASCTEASSRASEKKHQSKTGRNAGRKVFQ